MKYDAIIIGAGMSGLAAGIRLAHYGQRVLMLERQCEVGGMNSFYRRGNRLIEVGLHVVTNYAPRGMRGPLSKMLRQLRISWDDFSLVPQKGSSIRFPDCKLQFTNDIEQLKSGIREHFPEQIDGFERLIGHVAEYAQLGTPACSVSARSVVREFITDPQLEEMLFCPLLFYGGPRGRDLDFGQFSILFRSIYLEGFGRPRSGIRQILCRLMDRFCGMGGELRLKTGVSRLVVERDQIRSVILDDGTELEAKQILSSAGWPETLRMCDGGASASQPTAAAGDLAFMEIISSLDCEPSNLGIDDTATFFSHTPSFRYGPTNDFADLRSGMICCPDNYRYDQPLDDHSIRITALAGHERWNDLSPTDYKFEKKRWAERINESALSLVPDFRDHVTDTEIFTPKTIRRFTGRIHGAIYGAPIKRYDGRTHLENLFLCGTDQGMVGIIGSLMSGITIANRYCLQ